MRILLIAGLAVIVAGCQKTTQPKLPSVEEMRPDRAVGARDSNAPPRVGSSASAGDGTSLAASNQPTTAFKPIATAEPQKPKLDARALVALLEDAEASLKAKDNRTTVELVKQVVLSGKANEDQLIQSAQLLIRAGNVTSGVKLLQRIIQRGRNETKMQLMLVSALRLQAVQVPELRVKSILQAGKIVRQLKSSGELTPYGEKGIRLFVEVLATEASMCTQGGYRNEAIKALSDLSDTGIPQFEQLTQSPAYDPIRDMPEFVELLSRYRKSLRAQLQVGARKLIDEHAPYPFEFNLRDINGKRVTSADFPGKILVVDFWGTWCPPCRMETPELVKLQESYPHNVAVVGIAYEQGSSKNAAKSKVQAYVEEHDVNYTSLMGDARTKKAVKGGGLTSFPTLLFVDREGKVRLQVKGYHNFARLDAVVSLLLAEGS